MPLQNIQPLGHVHATGSMQAPLHNICVGPQAQLPLTQVEVGTHAMPQAPQLVALVVRSTHTPLQTDWPNGHMPVTLGSTVAPAPPIGDPTVAGGRGCPSSAPHAASTHKRPHAMRAVEASRNACPLRMDPTCAIRFQRLTLSHIAVRFFPRRASVAVPSD